jgi:hypothetical protein
MVSIYESQLVFLAYLAQTTFGYPCLEQKIQAKGLG